MEPRLPCLIIATRTDRIGNRALCQDSMGRFWVRLLNRTNNTWVRIPDDRMHLWRRKLA